MGTIADKLAYLTATKTAIIEALEARGLDTSGTTFRQLADKVLELANPITGLKLVPGYEFPEGSEAAVCALQANQEVADINLGYPAPAPTGVTLTPDAVGANPVTWYFKMAYTKWDVDHFDVRSEWTTEGMFTVGDDTTAIAVEGYSFPFWADGLNFILGTTSGVYTHQGNINDLSAKYWDYLSTNILTVGIKYHPIPIRGQEQAPAPTNITIVPDTAAVNPVTWYYKVLQLNSLWQRCALSAEQMYMQGDDTTELIFNCDHVDRDSVDIFLIIKGTTSGVYTNMFAVSFTPPTTIVPILDTQLPYDLLDGVDIPVGSEQIDSYLAQTSPLLLFLYDNELFYIDGSQLKFITAPDYAEPLDVDCDNVYRVLIVLSTDEETVEQEIDVEVSEVE